MESSNVVCPVCTLYLRPGMTLKNHLTSHPKQKVIEALVRLSSGGVDDDDKIENNNLTPPQSIESSPQGSSASSSSTSSQVNIVNQTWNQGNLVMPSPMPGNHVFIYQQSLSSTTAGQQQQQHGVMNVNPMSSPPQYVVPTVLNSHVMPYVYQQQQHQVIMSSSGSSSGSIRTLPFEVQSADGSNNNLNNGGDHHQSLIIEEVQGPPSEQAPVIVVKQSTVNIDDTQSDQNVEELVLSEKEEDAEEDDDDDDEEISKTDTVLLEMDSKYKHSSGNKIKLMYSDNIEAASSKDFQNVKSLKTTTDDVIAEEYIDNNDNIGSPGSSSSSAASDWSLRIRSDLNKACQTNQTTNPTSDNITNNIVSPLMVPVVNDENEILIDGDCKIERPAYYFVSSTASSATINNPVYSNVNATVVSSFNNCYDQQQHNNILQSNEHLDFIEMDGMQVPINDFSTNQIISQVEHFDNNTVGSDRPGVLMTIGSMIDHTSKLDDFNDQRDYEESMSRESSNVVNIRADERMPPRGELSGQESIGGASDITWNRVQYNDSAVMSTSYDLLARESWEEEASDCSDAEVPPPLQSRIPPPPSNEDDMPSAAMDYPDDDNDLPTLVSYSPPPLNFKCSTCGDAFKCLRDRKEHEHERHAKSLTNRHRRMTGIGAGIGKRKVKKLVVKLKSSNKIKTENNFDNVFTNKLKLESTDDDNNMISTSAQQVLVTENDKDKNLSTLEDVKLANPNIVVGLDELKTVCSLCDCMVLSTKALRQHKLEVHNVAPDIRHKCATCEETFSNEYTFTEHLQIHPLECKLCGKLFYRRQNIQMHMKRHLGIKPYKCESCDKSFLTRQKYNEHRNTHTGEAPIKCTLCDESFRRHSNLVQHRNRRHFNIKKKVKDYICFCQEVFHSKKKLAWHKEIHDAKPKACTQCSEKFIHTSSLTRHMRRAHNDRFLPTGHKNTENVECPICKGIYLKSSLEVHIRNHSGQRPFACLICNKDFTTKWNLKLHKWTHASRVSKPFKCDQCKGAFIREPDYVAHMNSHKSIRPYTCNYCGAQFIRKYNCQRHVKEHENEKTFNCKVCGKSFHRSYYLKDHMRIHSGVRPFACHICGKKSATKSNHNKHMQIHHAREPVSTEN